MKLRAGTKVRIKIVLIVDGVGEVEANRGWTISSDADHGKVGTMVKNHAKDMLAETARSAAGMREALKAAADGGPAPGAQR